ncbi:MAG: hypothetical protein ACK47B_16375 [Armatimonadota bacterium]
MEIRIYPELWPLYLFIVLLVVGILFRAAGGRAVFGHHERPERVLGKWITISNIDGLGADPPGLPPVQLQGFAGDHYLATFGEPALIAEKRVRELRLWARHTGRPISSASRRGILAVNVELDSGHSFMAEMNLA